MWLVTHRSCDTGPSAQQRRSGDQENLDIEQRGYQLAFSISLFIEIFPSGLPVLLDPHIFMAGLIIDANVVTAQPSDTRKIHDHDSRMRQSIQDFRKQSCCFRKMQIMDIFYFIEFLFVFFFITVKVL
jgi:hypothetical protein